MSFIEYKLKKLLEIEKTDADLRSYSKLDDGEFSLLYSTKNKKLEIYDGLICKLRPGQKIRFKVKTFFGWMKEEHPYITIGAFTFLAVTTIALISIFTPQVAELWHKIDFLSKAFNFVVASSVGIVEGLIGFALAVATGTAAGVGTSAFARFSNWIGNKIFDSKEKDENKKVNFKIEYNQQKEKLRINSLSYTFSEKIGEEEKRKSNFSSIRVKEIEKTKEQQFCNLI